MTSKQTINRKSTLSNFLRNFFSQLEIEFISYGVLRNYQDLPESAGVSDIDILILPSQRIQSQQLLREVIELNGAALVGFLESKNFSAFSVIGHGLDGWWGIKIEFYSSLSVKGTLELADVSTLLQSVYRHNGIYVLPDVLGNSIGFLKEVLTNGSPRCDKPQYLQSMLITLENGGGNAFNENLLKRFESKMISQMHRDPLGMNTPIWRRLTRDFWYWEMCRNPVLLWYRILHEISRFGRMRRSSGLLVAVLGTDGSGKSTIIEALRTVLTQAAHEIVPSRHLRPMLLPPLGRLRTFRGRSEADKPVTDPHRSPAVGRAGSLLRLIWLWMDYILGYWILVRPRISRSPVTFLFDRYSDDLALDPLRFRIGAFLNLARLIPHFTPRPDVVLALYARPEAIYARKPELPLSEIERQVAALKDWATTRPELVLISTDGSVESCCDECLRAIASRGRDIK